MTFGRIARTLLLLSPAILLMLVVLVIIYRPAGSSSQQKSTDDTNGVQSGKLVVLLVFDQLRGDYLDRWSGAFSDNGFNRIKAEGVWFTNVRLPYSVSSTAPGHASLSTGTTPRVHGIIENQWYDRSVGRVIKGVTLDGVGRVPYNETAARERWPGLTPRRLMAPTVGDALKSQIPNGRVYSFSLKDRAAVLMGGKEPNGVYCFDSSVGEFHSSDYYRKQVPDWLDTFDRSRVVERWSGAIWDRLGPATVYDSLGPDDASGESGRSSPGRRTFPYPLASLDNREKNYFESLESSAFGNELLWEVTKAAIAGEKIGQNGTTDLLCIGMSSNDIIGHAFGPDSHEVLDVTIRSDRLVGEIIGYLDETVGRDQWSLVITADHGICPLPEAAIMDHPTARRISLGDLFGGLEEYLDKVYGQIDGLPGQWLERDASLSACYPWVYLNQKTVDQYRLKMSDVATTAANWLRERPIPLAVFTQSEIESNDFHSETEKRLAPLVRESWYAGRSGDLYVVHPPYHLIMGPLSTGTDHGSPHDYDRNIPVLAFGAGVPHSGRITDAKSSLIIPPILAHLLGINPPVEAKEPLPDTFRKSK